MRYASGPHFSALAIAVLAPLLLLGSTPPDESPLPDTTRSPIVVDNFESYEEGVFPDQWVFVDEDKTILSPEEAFEEGEEFYVVQQGDNQFVRAETRDEAQRWSQRNGTDFDWNIKEHPWIQWRWRAHRLPKGASERGQNDTGGAVYVTFGSDWLGRPKSIKYTYSSSLPVGSVVSFGPLKVIVVDSKNEPRFGQWKTVQRNVRADYQQVFGGEPPERPVSITIWSDSDTTNDLAIVDFDDIKLLPPLRRR